MQRFALFLMVAVGLAACASNDSTPSSGPSSSVAQLAGNWTGTVTSNSFVSVVGVGTIHATLAQNGTSLNGSWNSTYANAANNNAGSVTGIIVGNSVTLTLLSGVPSACPNNATATLSGSSAMTGTYATFNCSVADGGQFNLTKQ